MEAVEDLQEAQSRADQTGGGGALAHTAAWSSKGPRNLGDRPGVRETALLNSFFDSLDF